MTWFKVDDVLHGHPKVIEVPLASMGLWTLAGSWCACYLTDGFIGFGALRKLGGDKDLAQPLVDADLWIREDTGFRFKNWEEFQPTKLEVEADRAKNAERMRNYRSSKVSSTATNSASASTPTRPDPTNNSGTKVPSSGTRFNPDNFDFGLATTWADANTKGFEIARELQRFSDYWESVAGARGRKANWMKTWQVWARKAEDDARLRKPHDPNETQARRNLATVEHFRQLEAQEALES